MASKRVLLTGANGYLAQHVLAQLLEAGHSVRGIVRSQSKVEQLQETFSKYNDSQLDFGIVPEIAAPGAFDQVLLSTRPFDAVVHTASPFNYRKLAGSSNAENFLDPAIKGTTEILNSITKVAPTVKRVVITSSIAAVLTWTAPKVTQPRKVYTGADWNPVTLEEANSIDNNNTAYQASKTYAEKAAWEIVSGISGAKPSFDLVTLCPPMIWGPVLDLDQFGSPHHLNQSTWGIYDRFMAPHLKSSDPVPPPALHLYVDVRECAKAHVLAATVPEAGGKRFVISAGNMSTQRIANLLREKLPEKRDVIPVGEPEEWDLPEGSYEASSEEAKKVLGLEFRTGKETFDDLAVQLVELEKKSAA